ncbi:MAG: GNAT family N-acetyltransferase [Bacteroidota bacterium]
MNLQPILENSLLLVRPMDEQDFDALFQVASDPLIWHQHPAKERCEPEGFKKFFAQGLDSGGAFTVIEKSSDQVIGSSRFNPCPGDDQYIEIGWTFFGRKYWGGPYNRSKKALMIDYALEYKNGVLFHVAKENIRSQKAVLKLGAQGLEGQGVEHLFKRPAENYSYLLNKADWAKG